MMSERELHRIEVLAQVDDGRLAATALAARIAVIAHALAQTA